MQRSTFTRPSADRWSSRSSRNGEAPRCGDTPTRRWPPSPSSGDGSRPATSRGASASKPRRRRCARRWQRSPRRRMPGQWNGTGPRCRATKPIRSGPDSSPWRVRPHDFWTASAGSCAPRWPTIASSPRGCSPPGAAPRMLRRPRLPGATGGPRQRKASRARRRRMACRPRRRSPYPPRPWPRFREPPPDRGASDVGGKHAREAKPLPQQASRRPRRDRRADREPGPHETSSRQRQLRASRRPRPQRRAGDVGQQRDHPASLSHRLRSPRPHRAAGALARDGPRQAHPRHQASTSPGPGHAGPGRNGPGQASQHHRLPQAGRRPGPHRAAAAVPQQRARRANPCRPVPRERAHRRPAPGSLPTALAPVLPRRSTPHRAREQAPAEVSAG